MSENVLYGLGSLALGGVTVVNWWFAMFSDSDYGEMCRDMLAGEFSLGRNTVAVIQPAVGTLFVFGGGLLLSEAAGLGYDEGPLAWFFLAGVLLSVVTGLLGLIPFPLPRLMYPEGQMERRWRRSLTEAEAAAADEAQRRADHPDDGSRPPYRGKHRK